MRTALGLLGLCGWLSLASCGGDSSGSFRDSLTFGAGMSAATFTLTGEAQSFSAAAHPVVYFRLESAANFSGRFVRLYFNRLGQKDFAACANADAHLCLSGFNVSTPGTYTVDAYLVATVVDIGKETLVTSATLTVTP